MTRLSVVVPALDEREHLPRLLDSLERADESPDEVLVVDGGSTDGTPGVAAGRAGVRTLASERGRGAQLAAGALEATGELLLFLHADARVEPHALAALRAAFEADDTLDAAGMLQRIEHGARVYRWIERAANARVRRGLVYGDSGLCVRRRAYDAAGGFRSLALFEDVDLSRRLRRRGRVRLVAGAGVVVSPRRWEREGVVRRTAWNRVLTLAFLAGVDPQRLARYYRAEPAAPSLPENADPSS